MRWLTLSVASASQSESAVRRKWGERSGPGAWDMSVGLYRARDRRSRG